jgi:ATP phosphoribosyltransferase regulatory subunit
LISSRLEESGQNGAKIPKDKLWLQEPCDTSAFRSKANPVAGLGNGGRYDHVGEAFGRSRPATGFAFDLKALVSQGSCSQSLSLGIFAPFCPDSSRREEIKSLRRQGFRVVEGFENQVIDYEELKCNRQLVKIGGKYIVEFLS